MRLGAAFNHGARAVMPIRPVSHRSEGAAGARRVLGVDRAGVRVEPNECGAVHARSRPVQNAQFVQYGNRRFRPLSDRRAINPGAGSSGSSVRRRPCQRNHVPVSERARWPVRTITPVPFQRFHAQAWCAAPGTRILPAGSAAPMAFSHARPDRPRRLQNLRIANIQPAEPHTPKF